jgi:hypothetical protein
MGANMKRFDPRVWLGSLMILGGVLALLENLNIIAEVGDVFWGLIWGGVGLYFLNRLITHKEWWAVFPAFALLGMAGSLLLPEALEAYGGLVFFGGMALAFLWVYFSDSSRWWAIIPAGVMLTLGTITVLDELGSMDTGGVLFLGLGLTFILVAVLPGGRSRTWALIPGVLLLVFGAVLGTPFAGLTQYLVPGLLIVLGGYFVLRFFRASGD